MKPTLVLASLLLPMTTLAHASPNAGLERRIARQANYFRVADQVLLGPAAPAHGVMTSVGLHAYLLGGVGGTVGVAKVVHRGLEQKYLVARAQVGGFYVGGGPELSRTHHFSTSKMLDATSLFDWGGEGRVGFVVGGFISGRTANERGPRAVYSGWTLMPHVGGGLNVQTRGRALPIGRSKPTALPGQIKEGGALASAAAEAVRAGRVDEARDALVRLEALHGAVRDYKRMINQGYRSAVRDGDLILGEGRSETSRR